MKGFSLYIFLLSITLICGCSSDGAMNLISSNNGQGGSLARISVYNDYIYVVNDHNLQTYNMSGGKLIQMDIDQLNFGVETIFPYQTNLFIGSVDAMYVFNIINPENPELVGQFNHQISCDPVVVENNYAYVSLRINSICGSTNFEDVIEILDVSNVNEPLLVNTFTNVKTPYGLGVSNNILFVCQYDNGLLLLDVTNKLNPVVIKTIDVNAYDVIVNNDLLILIGDDGLVMFDISNPIEPKQLSIISTE